MSDLFKARVERILAHAHGEYLYEDVLTALASKKMICLEFDGTLVLLEVLTYPQKRVLNIFGMEGKGTLAKLPYLKDKITDLARHLDCTEVRCHGRVGWPRTLKGLGVSCLYTILSVEV